MEEEGEPSHVPALMRGNTQTMAYFKNRGTAIVVCSCLRQIAEGQDFDVACNAIVKAQHIEEGGEEEAD